MSWKKSKDPLFRGDSAGGLSTPDPSADTGIVAHVLFLGGYGRATPFHSTTESESAAAHFAGSEGRVYRTTVPVAQAAGVEHVAHIELLRLLRGKGQGRAKWPSALEVATARRYVEQ